MGSGVIGGVLGGVQLISGIAGANSQANSQRRALEAQAQTTVDSSRIRQMEILQQRDAANFQASMNELARQQNYQNQTFLIERQRIQEQIDAQTTRTQADIQNLQTQTAIENKDAQTEQQMVGAEVDFQRVLQQLGEQLNQYNQGANQQLMGASDAVNQLGGRMSTRDVLYMASGLGVGSATSNQQQNADLLNTIEQVGRVLTGTQVGMEVQQRLTELTAASSESERNIKLNELASYLTDSNFQREISNIQRNATYQNVDSAMALNAAARNTAVSTVNAADSMNRQTDSVNRQLAEMGYQVQSTATQNATNNALAGINAQYSSIGGNTFAGLLSSGINAYGTYQGVLSQQRAVDQARQMAFLNQGLLAPTTNTNGNTNTFPGYN